jgi:hypothetical protein
MTDAMPINNEPLVVQEDKDMAARHFGAVDWNDLEDRLQRLPNVQKLVQAFARHRIKATSEAIERAAELEAALRKIADHDGVSYRFGDEVRAIANEALSIPGGDQPSPTTKD